MSAITSELFRQIKRIQIQTNRLVNDMMSGAYQSAFKGNGMQFEEVREYQTGDDVRSIDWNVTARMNNPYVKTFREERELTVMLLVDVSASSRFGSVNRLKSELIAEVAAVLAFSAIKNHDKVGLILFSDQVEKYLPPNKGTEHVLRVVRELLAFEPSHKGTNIEEGLIFLGKVQHRQTVSFLISDFIDTKDYSQSLKHIARTHDLNSIIVTDPREESLPNLGLIQIRDLESDRDLLIDSSDEEGRKAFESYVRNRKKNRERMLNLSGVGYLELKTDKPYALSIRQYFQRRERRT